jgi:hypothetical protein
MKRIGRERQNREFRDGPTRNLGSEVTSFVIATLRQAVRRAAANLRDSNSKLE